MSNTADVTGGKPIAVYLRCNAINPIVAPSFNLLSVNLKIPFIDTHTITSKQYESL
jgi:hypothetical protein